LTGVKAGVRTGIILPEWLPMEVLMESTKIIEYAHQLVAAHGPTAEAEAAQKALNAEQAGNADEAEQWRKVRTAIVQMKSPHAS
jgi:hypothetical protein